MAEFFHMGGYAAYVWSSYALAFLILVPMLLLPLRENTRLIRQIKGKLRRDQVIAKQQLENSLNEQEGNK